MPIPNSRKVFCSRKTGNGQSTPWIEIHYTVTSVIFTERAYRPCGRVLHKRPCRQLGDFGFVLGPKFAEQWRN